MTAAERLDLTLRLHLPDAPPIARGEWEAAYRTLSPPLQDALRAATAGSVIERAQAAEEAAAMLMPYVSDCPPSEISPGGAHDNDVAFGIERIDVTGVPGLLHPLMLTIARTLADLRDAGTSLSEADWRDLDQALVVLVASPFDRAISGRASSTAKPQGHGPGNAERRWVIGHHLFMVIAQGMALACARLTAAAKAVDAHEEERALVQLTALLRGSAAAFKYACDFSPEAYESTIRPSLSPPVAPEGMTGLNWRDHTHLMAKLRDARTLLADQGNERDVIRDQLRHAYTGMYGAHTNVCAHFVGVEESSLTISSTDRSAVGTLNILGQNRAKQHGITN